jgi:2-polyprenyl-6-methoxyphenol hydroxylase-like FAD-dependent oxidoreductase
MTEADARNDAVDVLIVGAGPVGLFLASECARRGLSHRIIEARAGQSEHSKALAIFPRTLEVFDMAGLVDPFLAAANRVTSIAVIAHQRRLADMRFAVEDSPYPFVAMVPQDVTERLLLERLEGAGGSVEYETEFVSADPLSDRVIVSLICRGEPMKLEARYVVGCDGAHSAVRHALDLPFEGGQYAASYMLADVDTNEVLPANQMQLCPNESGPLAIFPMSASRRRIVGTFDDRADGAPSLDRVQRMLRERGPDGLEARRLHWSSYFRIHHRQTTRLGVGRLFIAGDAAHIHSPFGGQGMNTGLQDVWNLAWKLDLAVRGHASELLLDSYTAERRPVIREVLETTDLLTKAMATPSKFAQALRDTLIPAVSRLAPFQHALATRLSGLAIGYHGSPIVEGPGKRYFADAVRGGKAGSRFLLIGADRDDADFKGAIREFAERFRDVVELRTEPREDLVLVRPDGYIAASSGRRKEAAALNSMASLLERQVR